MKTATFSVLITLSALLPLLTAQGVDLTLQREASGSDVVRAAVNRIQTVLDFDRQLLRRIAFVESRDGTDTDTYRPGYNGGIWQVDEDKFLTTQANSALNVERHDAIREAFDIDWPSVQWRDLRIPLYSGIAARLFLLNISDTEPIPCDIPGQAAYYNRVYCGLTCNETEQHFVESVNIISANRNFNSDIVMVLDESGNIGKTNFNLVKQFAAQYVGSLQIGPNDNRVGVITFGSHAREQFSLDTHSNATSLRNAVTDLPHAGGNINIQDALCQLLRVFSTEGRTDTSVFRVAMVLTDGRSTVYDNNCSYSSVAEAAAAVRAASPPINVFAIGVGKDVRNEDLVAIASQERYIVRIDNFSQLPCVQSYLEGQICNITTTVPRNTGTTNNGELDRGELVRWKFTISECGMSFNLTVQEGEVVLYASTEITVPNEAIYQWRIEVSATSNSFKVINIIPALEDNAVNCSSVTNVTVFTTIVGINVTNMFTVSTNAPQTQCPPLPAILNGFITYAPDNTPDYDLGTVATYACDIGFVLDLSLGGSEIKTCADNNRLDTIGAFDNLNQTLRCTPIECPPLLDIPNGTISYSPDVSPNFDLGTNATYTCDDGFYIMDVTEARVCMDENAMGVWSGQKPLCIAGCVAGIHQDHSWPNTALGSIALSPCPCAEMGVFAGNVSRQCSGSISEGGMWKDELDLSSCETTLSDISQELCEITLALSSNTTTTTQASNQIANITSKPQNLTTNQIAMVTSIVEQLTGEATVNQEVRDNYLQTINNIQLADAEAIYQSQLAMNSSIRILASLNSFLDNLNISTVSRNSTSNRTVFSFETFAITVQDVYPDSFQGQTFVVDLGPVEEAINNTGVIDQDALMKFNGGKGNTADNRSDNKNSTASLHLSPSILEDCPATNRTSLTQRLSYSVFLSGVLFLPENRSTNQVGSIVVAARLACLQTNKTVPVRTSFLIRTMDNINSSSCAVFNTQDRFGAWDTAGCKEIASSNGRKDCECRQLGHFGILFDLNPTSLPENLAIALSTITYIGLGLSVVCLLVFMFTIFISKKLLADKQNQILINMSISLICLYFTFLIGGFTVGVPPLCGFVSALLQYFFLVFFSWMAVEAVWLYIKLVVVMGSDSLTSKFMLKAGLPAWLLPFVIVAISAGAGHQHYNNPYYCRPTEWPFYFGFILPFVIIYVLNWIVFVAIMVSICKHFRNLQSLRESSVRQQLRNVKENLIIAMCLSIVLGLGWGLGLVSTSSGLVELSFTFQVIFSIFVGSQGVLIFILYGIRNTNFRQLWIKLFSGCRSNTDNFVSSEKGSTNPRDNSSTVGEELSSMSTLSSKQYSLHNEEKK